MITDYYRRIVVKLWSGWRDSNSRHPAPKAGALPDCATPRKKDIDPFSVKHFKTNIFFCKCFTVVRPTFDNHWCREGDNDLTIISYPITPDKTMQLQRKHNFHRNTNCEKCFHFCIPK